MKKMPFPTLAFSFHFHRHFFVEEGKKGIFEELTVLLPVLRAGWIHPGGDMNESVHFEVADILVINPCLAFGFFQFQPHVVGVVIMYAKTDGAAGFAEPAEPDIIHISEFGILYGLAGGEEDQQAEKGDCQGRDGANESGACNWFLCLTG